MSPASKRSMRRFRNGSAILLICLSLPVADRFREEVGAEMAAFWVFIFLFIAWFAVGLLMDALWRPKAGDVTALGYATKAE